jgi:hypothetical protein
VDVLPYFGSDHWPIVLEWKQILKQGPKPFCFKKFWLDHPDFLQNLVVWWREQKELYGTKMYQFQQRLKHVHQCIRKWNKEVFGNIFEENRRLELEMEEIQKKVIQGLH